MKGKKHLVALLPGWILLTALSVSATAQSSGFAGEWRTSQGKLNISIEGRTATGTYTGEGEMRGRVSSDGKLVAGDWTRGDVSGRFLLRLSSGGNGFNGTWYYSDNTEQGGWFGVRASSPVKVNPFSPDDFGGVWRTNYGTMNLTVEGTKVSGDFSGSVNSGSITGTVNVEDQRLIANWSDSKHKGRVLLNIQEGKQSVSGEWWYDDHEYGGFWYGVRYKATEGCISGDCVDGKGTYVWQDGSRYHGSWKNSSYDGTGTRFDAAGRAVQSGIWSGGIYAGKCLSGNCTDGNGKLKHFSGDVYEGVFSGGEMSGDGSYTFSNGDKFTGSFRGGKFYKTGTFTLSGENTVYEGAFSRGVIQGKGKLTYDDGTTYQGTFRKGQRYGNGTMIWPDGDKYDGRWADDQMNGKGVYSYGEGDTYTGHTSNNLRDGNGTYTFSDGTSIQADWEDDNLVSTNSNTGYSGIAANVSEGVLPSHLAMNIPPATPQLGPDAHLQSFVCFTVREYDVTAASDLGSPKEMHINYYYVYAGPDHDEESVAQELRTQLDLSADSDLRVERATDPGSHLKRLLSRFRLGGSTVKINTYAAGYLRLE